MSSNGFTRDAVERRVVERLRPVASEAACR